MMGGPKSFLAPALLGRLKSVLHVGNYFTGEYSDWAAASAVATGYDAEAILERVRASTRLVRSGAAKYERDSVVFDHVEHSFPVLAAMLRAGAETGGTLSVLDFGGSLGSSYRQCREFLRVFPNIAWGVVEQQRFVECGRAEFETDELKFYYTIDECVERSAPNAVLFSSVLQYLGDPYAILTRVVAAGIPYVVIDRTVFSEQDSDRIAIQHVPAQIYRASYPIRIFGKHSLRSAFESTYESIAEFDVTWDGSHIEYCDGLEFRSRGMIFHKGAA